MALYVKNMNYEYIYYRAKHFACTCLWDLVGVIFLVLECILIITIAIDFF